MKILTTLFLLLVFASTVAASDTESLSRYQFDEVKMAMPIRLVFYAENESVAQNAADAAFKRIDQLEQVFSDYIPESEIRRLGETSGSGKPMPVSDDLYTVMKRSIEIGKCSDGAFDVTIAPLVRLWRRAHAQGRLPQQSRIDEAKSLVGLDLIRLDDENQTVELLRKEMRIDVGGIAKGYIIDQALAELRKHGIDRALVDAGGDVGIGHAPPGRNGWVIGVAPPEKGAISTQFLELADCAIATSGDTWRFVVIDGVRYSHIVDPKTGIGLTDHSIVTVIAPDATTADALASAVSVLGPEKGIALIEATDGTAAMILRRPEGDTQTYRSKHWSDYREAEPLKTDEH